MRKRSTILCVGVGVLLGAALFVEEHRVKTMEDELVALNRGIVENREAVHVLRAEWSYLNRPDRLQRLSDDYLIMQPVTAAQLSRLENLPLKTERVAADASERRPARKPVPPVPPVPPAARPTTPAGVVITSLGGTQ